MNDEERLKRRWQKEDDAAVDNAIRALLLHRETRKFLWWQLEQSGIGKNPFASNALQMSFNCGKMNTGQSFLARIIEVDPNGYVKMMTENADERRKRDDELWNARNPGASGGNPSDGNADDDLDANRRAILAD